MNAKVRRKQLKEMDQNIQLILAAIAEEVVSAEEGGLLLREAHHLRAEVIHSLDEYREKI